MSAAERKAAHLIHALRGVELDERHERFIGWAGQMWDQDAIEACCSMLELVREAGYLLSRSEGGEGGSDTYVRKPPGERGSLSGIAGATYTGDEGNL
jgi:hypothetical protein